MIADLIRSMGVLISTAPGGLMATKLTAGFKLAILIAPIAILSGITNWFYENSLYVEVVVLAILCDWFLGSIKHNFWTRDFHWLENIKGILVKSLLVIAMGGVFEGLMYFTNDVTGVALYAMTILRLTVFMYPAMSIVRSSRVISDGKFPPQGLYDAIESWTANLGKKK